VAHPFVLRRIRGTDRETAMDAIVENKKDHRPLVEPRARVGLIVPSVNRMSEPQFNHFAPPGLAIHVARARITGPWRKPAAEMTDEMRREAGREVVGRLVRRMRNLEAGG